MLLSSQPPNAAELAHADEGVAQRDLLQGPSIRKGAIVLLGCWVAVSPLFFAPIKWPQYSVILAAFALASAWPIVRRTTRIPSAVWFTCINFLCVARVTWSFKVAVVEGELVRLLMMQLGYIGLTFVSLFGFPYGARRLLYIAFAFYLACPLVAWGRHPAAIPWIAIHTVMLTGAFLFHRVQVRRFRANAIADYRARLAIARAERAHIDRELSLARAIQESLVPAEMRLDVHGYEIDCWQVPHDTVGGDWLAVRAMPDGRIIALVADAVGKGMRAALVVHTCQSLWAEALDDDDFDPEAWIHRVNRTLFRLGKSEPHALTLGLVVVSAARIEYWSAAHLPLFLMTAGKTAPKVQRLFGYGNMLGIQRDIELRSAILAECDDMPGDIILGSDGIFPGSELRSDKRFMRLFGQIQGSGINALRALESADDRTMIWLRRKDAVWGLGKIA